MRTYGMCVKCDCRTIRYGANNTLPERCLCGGVTVFAETKVEAERIAEKLRTNEKRKADHADED